MFGSRGVFYAVFEFRDRVLHALDLGLDLFDCFELHDLPFCRVWPYAAPLPIVFHSEFSDTLAISSGVMLL